LIEITSSKSLRELLNNSGSSGVKLICSRRSKKGDETSTDKSSKTTKLKDILPDTSALDNMVDGIVIIDTKGIVLFFNKAAEVMWGYSRDQIVSFNVRLLMPAPHSLHHNSYIEQYLRTGVPKIIGTSRKILAQHSNGSTFLVELSVTETKVFSSFSSFFYFSFI
jgi:PAS domain S-box-containing protein